MLIVFQPLMDNLQSVTYQTFEQDPVKYSHYEEVNIYHYQFSRLINVAVKAMYRALVEWPGEGCV
jgi:protein arginine N-methyltransferase 5